MPNLPSMPDAANERLARTLCCAVDGAGADSDDRAHVFRSDAAQRSKLIARRLNT